MSQVDVWAEPTIQGIEALEDLEAPGFWEWAAGVAGGIVVGGGALWLGVAVAT